MHNDYAAVSCPGFFLEVFQTLTKCPWCKQITPWCRKMLNTTRSRNLPAVWHKFNSMPAGNLPIVPAHQRLAEEGNGNGRIGHQILAAAFESAAQNGLWV